MCLMMKAYCETKDFKVSLINDGDDCVLFCDRKHADKFGDMGEWFGALGMIMTVEPPVYELEHVEFCQSRPVMTNQGTYRMVRDPRVCLTKDVMVVKPVFNESDFRFFRRAIGQCGLSLAGDMPIYSNFYQMLIRGTTHADMKNSKGVLRKDNFLEGMQFLSVRMQALIAGPTPECRVSFAKAFGILPDYQEALETEYDGVQLSYDQILEVHKFGELIAGRV
jgi:hypothetical protein